MKIVFLARTLNQGGAQRQLVALAKGLKERGHSIHVMVFYANGFFENELRTSGIDVRVLHRRGRWNVVSLWWQMVRIVRELNPDILHGYLETPNVCAALLRRSIPQAKVVFGIRASAIDYEQYDFVIRVMNWIEARAAHYADLVIANSHAGAADVIRAGFPSEKVVIISNGIDTERFVPNAEARKIIRQQWKIKDDEFLIGVVGRLDPKKDHATFLRAAAKLKQSNLKFVCIGVDEPTFELQQLAESLQLQNRLQWITPQSAMPDAYNALDVMCLSSAFGEGFPNVVGEAMACGVPCVVTNSGDSALIVGDLGEVVTAGDDESMAAAINKSLNQNRQTISIRLRQRVIENFSLQELMKKTESALLALI
jgi:glycosyltransferase involved in cell wall biosynthesis